MTRRRLTAIVLAAATAFSLNSGIAQAQQGSDPVGSIKAGLLTATSGTALSAANTLNSNNPQATAQSVANNAQNYNLLLSLATIGLIGAAAVGAYNWAVDQGYVPPLPR